MNKKDILLYIGIGIIVIIIILMLATGFKKYTVTFNSTMGTSVKVQEIRKNKQAKEPKEPIMDGYIFKGWYLDDEKYDFSKRVTKDITLTGKWEKAE